MSKLYSYNSFGILEFGDLSEIVLNRSISCAGCSKLLSRQETAYKFTPIPKALKPKVFCLKCAKTKLVPVESIPDIAELLEYFVPYKDM